MDWTPRTVRQEIKGNTVKTWDEALVWAKGNARHAAMLISWNNWLVFRQTMRKAWQGLPDAWDYECTLSKTNPLFPGRAP